MAQPQGEKPGLSPSELLRLNRQIAYLGRVGRRRAEYCREELRYLQVCHRKIAEDQLAYVAGRGETISCGKGCAACCHVYVGATLQECEAIAYYLTQHPLLYESFLGQYPAWRETVRQGGDAFRCCEELFTHMLLYGGDKREAEVFQEALRRHNRQNVFCPFLKDETCSIYEARPSNCAGLFTTHPPAACRQQDTHDPTFSLTSIEDVVQDVSFYYGSLGRPVTLYMPVAVYHLLAEGVAYLAQFPGLEGLAQAALHDPEVVPVLRASLERPG